MNELRLQYEDYQIVLRKYSTEGDLPAGVYPPFYHGHEDWPVKTTFLGVQAVANEQVLASFLITGCRGSREFGYSDYLIDDDQLVFLCDTQVCCLALPDLTLRWCVEADWADCFRLMPLPVGGYLVHGELRVTRLDRDGSTIWDTIGPDVFVNLDGTDECVILEDRIVLTDFENNVQVLDFDGNALPGGRIG